MKKTDVTVIGGGASGLMAAIFAARGGSRTQILEHMDRVGKKILSTGNGKCNYTNALQGESYYRGENPAFVMPIFAQFGHKETVELFAKLGIYPKERTGYFYPKSEQAAAVLEVLRMECEHQGVEITTSCELKAISRCKEGYRIETNCGDLISRKLIFATGLLAAPKTGSDGSAFPYIRQLGHHFCEIVPALVPLMAKQSFFKALAGVRTEASVHLYIDNSPICSETGEFHFCEIVPALVPLMAKQSFFKALAGVRTEASVHLYIDNSPICSETGELQLTDYGISGIPVFQISRFATKALAKHRKVTAKIDFLPALTEKEVSELLLKRFHTYGADKDCSQALIGLFNKKLIDVLLKESGIDLHLPAKKLGDRELRRLCETICGLSVEIIGSKPVDAAQVCAGGIPVCEVEQETLESKLAPGVYFAGEVLDIDGICGGYNLQWAWASGAVAGSHAADAARKAGKEQSHL